MRIHDNDFPDNEENTEEYILPLKVRVIFGVLLLAVVAFAFFFWR